MKAVEGKKFRFIGWYASRGHFSNVFFFLPFSFKMIQIAKHFTCLENWSKKEESLFILPPRRKNGIGLVSGKIRSDFFSHFLTIMQKNNTENYKCFASKFETSTWKIFYMKIDSGFLTLLWQYCVTAHMCE